MASTAAAASSSISKQGELTARLREWTAQVTAISTTRAELTGKIYRAAYDWVSIAVIRESAKTAEEGIKKLAATLGKTPTSVANWYRFGQFMHKHALDPDRCNSGAVRTLYSAFSMLNIADQHRGIALIRGGREAKEIVKLTGKSSLYSQRTANRRAERLHASGKLTKVVLRGHLLATKALYAKYLGDWQDIKVQIMVEGKIYDSI